MMCSSLLTYYASTRNMYMSFYHCNTNRCHYIERFLALCTTVIVGQVSYCHWYCTSWITQPSTRIIITCSHPPQAPALQATHDNLFASLVSNPIVSRTSSPSSSALSCLENHIKDLVRFIILSIIKDIRILMILINSVVSDFFR